jgi:hypothetical protein
VILVAESEWGAGPYVKEDFVKLPLARAELRLMIFDGTTIKQCSQLVGELCSQARSFARSQSGDEYLFAIWQENGFEFWKYTVGGLDPQRV